MKPSWKFGNNDTHEVEGPNNPGIANFADDRVGGLVREIIQNSIDAKASKTEPVEVSLRVEGLPVENLDLPGLKRAVIASRKSDAIDERHKAQFGRAVKTLNSASRSHNIVALTITDSNTLGAPDEKGQRDKWHSLTKTVGLSAKDTRDSGGSFGIGKHAAFAAADMRTVLYSTAYRENGAGSALRRRFTGKSILVSHEVKGKPYRATGWLESEDGPLRDYAVPSDFQLCTPGMLVSILGFDNSNMEAWTDKAKTSLVTHFFHALAHDNLQVRIEDIEVNNNSLDSVSAGMGQEVESLIRVSRSDVKDHTDIDGIGRVNLRIIVDEWGGPGQKTLALVRDAGMMISKQLGDMRITPSQRMVSFPRNWMGFTAIVECLSEGEESLLREAEGPRHDKVSSDYADSSDRRKVSRALRELGTWIRDAIGKHAKPPDASISDNASEIAELLPLYGEGVENSSQPGRGQYDITEPQQSHAAPRSLRTPRRRATGQRRGPTGGSGGGKGGTGKSKGRGRRKSRRNVPVETSFQDIRRLPSTLTQWPEHAARFAFDKPEGAIKRIRLYAIGEEGRDTQVKLERAYIGGRKIKVRDGDIVDAPGELMTGDRVQVEIKAIRPIADKRLEVRFVE